MMLITYWGENDPTEDYLHDYAYKEWSGLMTSYYKARWELWFDYLRACADGVPTEEPHFFFWEREWAENNRKLITSLPETTFEEIVARVLP